VPSSLSLAPGSVSSLPQPANWNPKHHRKAALFLLDVVYDQTRREVEDKLKTLMPYGLNIITDESADINKNRIVSMSVNGSRLTFFHKAQDMQGANLNAVSPALTAHFWLSPIDDDLDRILSAGMLLEGSPAKWYGTSIDELLDDVSRLMWITN
jgi:hypothetical protein